MQPNFKFLNLLPAEKAVLMNDIFLILLHVTKSPPHLLISVNGKTFALSTNGATIDGELLALLHLINKKNIPTIFIRLSLPPLFTMDQLKAEIRKCTLAYPRVDIGIATCLTPINDFCSSIYNIEKKNVKLIFDLLPKLHEQNNINAYYYMNLPSLTKLINSDKRKINSFELDLYDVNTVQESIRKSSFQKA